MTNLQFQINKLIQESQAKTTEAVMIIIGALFTAAMLPSLIIQYIYLPKNPMLMEQPITVKHIPLVAFLVAAWYLVWALLGNMRRSAQIKKLSMELNAIDSNCSCDDDDESWDKELKELEALLEEDQPKKKTSTKAAKKTTKRKPSPKSKKTKK